MAYDPHDLSVVGYANGFTLWHFQSRDPAAALLGRHYFGRGSRMLRPGDFIFVNFDKAARMRSGLLAVESVADGAVEVTPLAGEFPRGPASQDSLAA